MILCIVNSVFQTLVFVPREMKRCICLAGNAISFHDLVFFCHGILPAERPRDRSRRINVFRSYLRVFPSSVLRSLATSVTRSHVHLRPRSHDYHSRDPSPRIRNHEIGRFLCPLQLGQNLSVHDSQKGFQGLCHQYSRGDFLHIFSI